MILADTSVWVDHLRSADERLKALLAVGRVLMHPCIMGEIALGHVRKRDTVLQLMADMPQAIAASDAETLGFIKRYALYGQGIGYVDAHLLAAAQLNSATLWTRDKRLHAVAVKLGLTAK